MEPTAPHGESDGARLRRLCVPGVARPERLDFSGADLSGADLSWLNLSGVIFGCAKLVGTKLYGSLLTGCDFRDADLTGADLRRSSGEWANFERAQFGGARLCRAYIVKSCYKRTNFGWKGLSIGRGPPPPEDKGKPWQLTIQTEPKEYDPAWAAVEVPAAEAGAEADDKKDAAEMETWRAVVKASQDARYAATQPDVVRETVHGLVDLNRAVLAHSDMQCTNFMGANMRRAVFRFSRLQGLPGHPEWGGASIAFADLRGANFTSANLTSANIAGARLDATTDMEGADLTSASFTNTSFGSVALPPRKEARPPASGAFWARLLCTSAAKQAFSSGGGGGDDDSDDDDDNGSDDDEDDEDEGGAAEALAEQLLGGMADAAATALRRVGPACAAARKTLQEAVEAARGESERVAKALEAAAAAATTASSSPEIERLLTVELKRLLERFATRLRAEASAVATEADGDGGEDDAMGAMIASVVDGAIEEVRLAVERRAAPIVKRCAGAISQAVVAAPLLPRRAQRLGRPVRTSPPSAVGGGGAAKVSPEAAEQAHQAEEGEAEPAEEETERTPFVAIGATTAQICQQQLDSLLDQLDACLAEPAELLRTCATGAGAHLLRKAGFYRRLGSLGKRATALAEKTRGKLGEGCDDLRAALNTEQLEARVRRGAAAEAMGAASRFAIKGWRAVPGQVLRWKPTELVQHANELRYLKEKLTKLEDSDVTEQGWLDLYESWTAVLALRSRLEDECAQQVLCAIASDGGVLSGLAVAHVLRNTRFETGKAPDGLLFLLKQGPVKHMKSHAYRYQQKIDRELAKIERIQTLQQRAVGLVGTLIISTSIGISNFVSRRVYTTVYGDGGA